VTPRELFELYSRVAHVYPRHDESNLVSSHNDLKPENILLDGDCVWLVDWEAAFLNDRYVDLAVVANFAVNSEADEQAYLHRYGR
jgi:thiamine kinase-like enzyme